MLCAVSRWVVCNSEYAVDDPTFLCERCIRNTHYGNAEMKKLMHENQSEANNDEIETKDAIASTSQSIPEDPEEEAEMKKLFNFQAYHFSQL